MSQYVLEAKDCLPFEIKGGNKKPIIVDTAMRQFCNYWYKTDGYSNDDDYLALQQDTIAVPRFAGNRESTTGVSLFCG